MKKLIGIALVAFLTITNLLVYYGVLVLPGEELLCLFLVDFNSVFAFLWVTEGVPRDPKQASRMFLFWTLVNATLLFPILELGLF